jgi:NAD(P)H dehydrogenase (quinone)
MLLVSINNFAKGQRLTQHRCAIKAATHVGIDHIVYTSFMDLTGTELQFLSADHLATEELLLASSSGYTVLRNSFYADILLPVLDRAASSRVISTAAGTGRVAYITREDAPLRRQPR